jgi:regulator of RNase E activity RraA
VKIGVRCRQDGDRGTREQQGAAIRGGPHHVLQANGPARAGTAFHEESCAQISGQSFRYDARRNGVAGAIIDGATRDGPEIRASGFPTFVRGMTPVTSKWDLKTASINEPVMLGPVQVNPGDIVFADETGVVIIPAAKLDLVLRKCIEIREAEEGRPAQIPHGLLRERTARV